MKFFENFKFGNLFSKKKIDQNLLDKFEELLIQSDVGTQIAADLKEKFKKEKIGKEIKDEKEIFDFLGGQISKILSPYERKLGSLYNGSPSIIVVAGVNGAGKTTTIGKLGKLFKNDGKKIVFGAADTFRAAASEQLSHWAEKLDVEIVKQPQGSDPGAVVYDSYRAAVARSIDVLLIDTAGRMNNKSNLMDELAKIKRILTQHDETAPHEVILVLDATTGLNGLEQAKSFTETTQTSGIFLTKLDGTSKGGVVFPITSELGIPVMFIGTGETEDDIAYFDPQQFVEAILET